jgi:regulatory protein
MGFPGVFRECDHRRFPPFRAQQALARDRSVSDEDLPGDAPPARRRRPEPTPQQRALGLLVRREHSRKELLRKLAVRGVDADDAQAAVARMTAEGWQDDARFAETLIRSRAGTGYGPLRIRAELASHGLAQDLIAEAMAASEQDWGELARDLVRRRFAGALGGSAPAFASDDAGQDIAAPDPALRRKAAEFLLRRGFSGDQVRAATRHDPDDSD